MTLIVLLSPGGAPGVTTTALALARAWPRKVVVAECDRSGGTVLAGLWSGAAPRDGSGLLRLVLDGQRHTPADIASAIRDYLIPLDERADRWVLPGAADPVQSRQLASSWPALAAGLAALDADVIADAGRFDADLELNALLTAATVVVMVLRPVVRQIVAARSRLVYLRRLRVPLGLATVGEGPFEGDGPRLAADALAAPLLFDLPDDGTCARILSIGAVPPRGFACSPLMRAAEAAAQVLSQQPAEACLPAQADEYDIPSVR